MYTDCSALAAAPEGARGFSCFKSARSNYWEELTMVDSAEMLESVDRRLMGGKEDRYGGFIVDNHSLPDTLDAFRDVLKNSLQVCVVDHSHC